MNRRPHTLIYAYQSILLVILTSILGSLSANAQSSADSTKSHKEEIVPGSTTNFQLFDDRFYANQLFLLGESHGVAKPQEVDFALLKHLNQQLGLRYYIAEVDYTKAYYLNQYLKTGNDSTLMRVFRSWIQQQAQWGNKDFFRKIQKIRALNLTLPTERRIRFIGVDVIHDNALVVDHITDLLAAKELPKSIRVQVDTLLAQLKQPADSVTAQTALHWLSDMQKNEATYRRAWGTAADDLLHLLTNISSWQTKKSREAVIVANFKTLFMRQRLENEKLYGFWGFWHVLQAPTNRSVMPMAAQLRQSNLPIRDKLVSITFSYVDCFSMVPTTALPPFWQDKGKTFTRLDKFNSDGPMLKTEGIEQMKANSQPNSLTLFALDYDGSPFRQTPVRINYAPFMPDSQKIQFDPTLPTTDYFQYVILVRNSDMTEPFVR